MDEPKAPLVLDRLTFLRLIEEGQEMRRVFDAQTAKMRVLTPADWKVVVR